MQSAGDNLRKIRDRLGLTMRDVESASHLIAQRHESDEYLIPPSRLSDIETKGVLPSIYRLYSLAAVYHREMQDMLQIYGIDLNAMSADWDSSQPAHTHVVTIDDPRITCTVPIKMDPAFDLRETSNLGRMVQEWGPLPFTFLRHLASQNYIYAFIGHEDLTMYPLLPPGSFVQVDESEPRRRVVERQWRNEHERPIYFVETRDGFTCCWCQIKSNMLVLQPHSLSPAQVRILKHPQEAEVIGQVVGAAIRMGGANGGESQGSKESSGPKPNAVPSSEGNLKAITGEDPPSISQRKKLG